MYMRCFSHCSIVFDVGFGAVYGSRYFRLLFSRSRHLTLGVLTDHPANSLVSWIPIDVILPVGEHSNEAYEHF